MWLAWVGCHKEEPTLRPTSLDGAVLVSGQPGDALGTALAEGGGGLVLAGRSGRVCLVPEATRSVSVSSLPCVQGPAEDAFGAALAGDLALQDGSAWLVGAPSEALGGAVHAFDADLAELATFRGGSEGDRFGASLLVSDFDDDGATDLLVGAPGTDHLVADAGAAYVFFGPVPGGEHPDADAGALFDGGQLSRHAGDPGYALARYASALDADGDGVVDLLLSQGGTDVGDTQDVGAAFLYYGPMYRATVSAAPYADAQFLGTRGSEYAGEPVCGAGDLSGDGRADLALVANGFAPERAGVFFGPFEGERTLDEADLRLDAARPGEATGSALAWGDLDLDGEPDLLLGSPNGGDGAQGEVRLLYGPLAPGVLDLEDVPAIPGLSQSDAIGAALVILGEGSLAIGMPGVDSGAGAVALLIP